MVEVVGKPKEHVQQAIKTIVDHASKMEGITLVRKDIAPTKKFNSKDASSTEGKIIERTGDLFSTFAELEFKAKGFEAMEAFCFEFLPSSFEIIEPEDVMTLNRDLSKLMNDFLARIHTVDMHVKRLNFENQALRTNAGLLLRNMIIVSVKAKPKNLEDLSQAVGIPTDQLTPFLGQLKHGKFIKEENGIYSA